MSIHEKGDYLKYDGNFKPHGIVKLLEKVQNNKERLKVEHLKDGSVFLCDYEDVDYIYTEEKHILKAGFTKVNIDNKEYYKNNEMLISTVDVEYPHPLELGNAIFKGN